MTQKDLHISLRTLQKKIEKQDKEIQTILRIVTRIITTRDFNFPSKRHIGFDTH